MEMSRRETCFDQLKEKIVEDSCDNNLKKNIKKSLDISHEDTVPSNFGKIFLAYF